MHCWALLGDSCVFLVLQLYLCCNSEQIPEHWYLFYSFYKIRLEIKIKLVKEICRTIPVHACAVESLRSVLYCTNCHLWNGHSPSLCHPSVSLLFVDFCCCCCCYVLSFLLWLVLIFFKDSLWEHTDKYMSFLLQAPKENFLAEVGLEASSNFFVILLSEYLDIELK